MQRRCRIPPGGWGRPPRNGDRASGLDHPSEAQHRFITDISVDPSCTAGDLQQGGPAYDPVAIFGTWKSATEDASHVGTPDPTDPMANNWDLTSQADPLPASASAAQDKYGTEMRFEVGLISGHSYRIQVIAHDGDQNKGGDSGEACATFCAGTGTLCDPGVTQCAENPDGASCPADTTCVQGCCLPIVQWRVARAKGDKALEGPPERNAAVRDHVLQLGAIRIGDLLVRDDLARAEKAAHERAPRRRDLEADLAVRKQR